METHAQELQSILGCSYEQALQALHNADGNMEVAMNRLLDGSVTAPTARTDSDAAPVYAPPYSQSSKAPVAALPPPASTTDGDDKDADLQRAMAESMAPCTTSKPDYMDQSADDEQLMRVLAESVQSISGQTEMVIRPELQRLRSDEEPVSLVPSIPTYRTASLVLQALFAAEPARRALLGFPLPDDRTHDLSNYWAGASPSQQRQRESAASWVSVPAEQHKDLDLVQRIQTLFLFMYATQRAVLVTGDTDAVIPSDVALQASRHVDMHVLVEAYMEALCRTWNTAIQAVQPAATPNTQSLFESYAAVALNDPCEGHDIPPVVDAQPTSSITLVHTTTEADVASCLWRKLTGWGGMESLLITRPAQVLVFCLQHEDTTTPFQIDPVLYMDPFLWDHRRGYRLDAQSDLSTLQTWESELQQRQAQRTSLLQPAGKPLSNMWKHCLSHMQTKSPDEGTWLSDLQQAWQAQLQRMEKEITHLQTQIATARDKLAKAWQQHIQDSSLQTVPYDVCAVTYQTHDSEWIYVYHHEAWWRIERGHATKTTWDAVQADASPQGAALVELVYQQRGPVSPPEWTHLQGAFEQMAVDNQRAQEETHS